MEMGVTGTPWLDQPVMLHSSRADKCKLTPEQCAFRNGHWRYWYQADHLYALNTVYFFVATISLCIIGYWTLRMAPARLQSTTFWRKGVSSARFLAYRPFYVKPLGRRVPPLGVSLLLIVGAVFFLAMTLGPQPYYWPNTATVSFGSSPPLATRAGWMAVACLPFMLILPTKTNMIATLTGVSHERLIVFHNWTGWAMLALALVHTFPFIVYHIKKGDMVEVWNTSLVYWTGVVAIISQAYLQFMSLPWIRNRFYEFFKATHFLAAVVFVVFFFFHCDFRLTSWDYFIAAGVLYAPSFLASQMRTYFEFGFHRATFDMVSDSALKITIPIQTKWQPGQHMFLRFITLGAHTLTAHPFSICSVPNWIASGKNTKLVFYVHPRGGVTGRLAKAAAQKPGHSVPVLLDGPYGGIKNKPLRQYDRSLVIACGSGASLSLPYVMDILLHAIVQPVGEIQKSGHRMRVVIATRDSSLIEFYEEALLEFLDEYGIDSISETVQISVYQTGPAALSATRSSEDSETQVEKGAPSAINTSDRLPIRTAYGRPDVAAIVKETTLQQGVSVGIVACGPGAVLSATQREAANAQLRIMRSKPGAREVFLHTESFSW